MTDFRFFPFDSDTLGRCGKYIGRHSYWKLYVIENFFRIVIHSVLSVQFSTNWWEIVVDKKIREKATNFQKNYLAKAWHGKPGGHGIFYDDCLSLGTLVQGKVGLKIP